MCHKTICLGLHACRKNVCAKKISVINVNFVVNKAAREFSRFIMSLYDLADI